MSITTERLLRKAEARLRAGKPLSLVQETALLEAGFDVSALEAELWCAYQTNDYSHNDYEKGCF